MFRRILLGCGVVAPLWWVAMDVVGSLRYPGYSYVDQTISELSAEGAPTRTFMTLVSGIPYVGLMAAFGVGVWLTAGKRRAGRLAAALLVGEAVWGMVGGIAFPMTTREAMAAGQETLRNEMHGVYGIGMPILFMLAIVFGSRLFGTQFRRYSIGTIVVLLVFGLLTALQTDAVKANEGTPWLGVIERTNAYAAMLWIAVFSGALLRAYMPGAARPLRKPALTPQRVPR